MDNNIKRIYFFYFLFSAGIITYGFILFGKTINPPGHACMFRSLFHIPCAGCGGSHAIHSLLKGNIPDAFRYNALISIVFISALVLVVFLVVDLLFHKTYLLMIHKELKAIVRNKKKAYSLAGGLILFWLYHIWKF